MYLQSGILLTPVLLVYLRLTLTCRCRCFNRVAVAWDIEDTGSDVAETERCVRSNENRALLLSEKSPGADKEIWSTRWKTTN